MAAMAATIDRALRFWARDRADQAAINVSGLSLTYGELDRSVGRCAAMLSDIGLRPGDRIGFYAETSIEWCVAALGAIRAGGIVAPINARMVAAELDYLLGQYEPVLMFVDAQGAARLATGAAASVPRVDQAAVAALRAGGPADIDVPLDPDGAVAIITTSGSTARPKGVVYSHRAMIEYAWEEHVHNAPDLGGGETRLLTASPLSTAGGFNLMIHMVIVGGTIFLMEKFDPGQALRLLVDQRINVFRAAPIFLQRIAGEPDFADADLSALRIATVGGAAPSTRLLDAWWDRGVVLRQLYGQTEVGGGACVNPIRFARSHPDRCGLGGPMTEIAIIDEGGRRLPTDTPGQIVVRKPGVMSGYWRNEEATAAALVDGWVHTGDIGEVDGNGLLRMVGRMKDFIKSGGLNISAAELEQVIMDIDGIDEVAVLGVPDDEFGETPLAIVHGPGIDVPSLMTHCRTHLSSYKLPRYVVVSDTPLPRLAMGKISKPALRETHLSRPLPAPVR